MTATYNEVENVPRLVDEVYQVAPQADFLVVDDNSPDGTGAWCKARTKSDKRFHCIHRSGKLGLGTAIVEGMQYAIANGYEYVLNIDADFSHQPKYIPAMLAGMDPAGGAQRDVMISTALCARRRQRELAATAKTNEPNGKSLRPLAAVAETARCKRRISLLSGGKTDGVGFFANAIDGLLLQEEILWMLRRLGARFGETPIIFAERRQGVSETNHREAWAAMRIILQLGLRSLTGR